MPDRCIACGVRLQGGDKYVPDISGGVIHFDCCDPEGFVDLETGTPLSRPPEPHIWSDAPAPANAAAFIRDNQDSPVVRLGTRLDGRPFYRLENGALYELDAADVAYLAQQNFRPRLSAAHEGDAYRG